MKIKRRHTTAGQDVFTTVEWANRTSRITNADGSVVFEMKDAEIPASWSQLAVDIMVSKYFRKAGVPRLDEHGAPVLDKNDKPVTGPETSVRQVVHRLAGCWRAWGEQHNYFESSEDAKAFYDELAYMMLHQMVAPNSPQWFNTGLHWAYGMTGPAQGHWVPDPTTGEARPAPDAYSHPQPHACFIQSVEDDLVGEEGIMDLWSREARLFKYGSGTGTNFSKLRGENESLSGGGKSSGLMSFLKIGDRAAGAIKSGGTTRRAAKMVTLDIDHPDVESFINWKVREEIKVAALAEGLKHLSQDQQDLAEDLGLKLNYDFNGEAYYTVSGQNSNNSIRVTDEFLRAVEAGDDWNLTARTNGETIKTIPARDLWNQICRAAWHCADPGLQYDTTINDWHTCPKHGRINASNPCSEYMFLDNTACNLASINLMRFYDAEQRVFDVDGFEHAIELWTVVLEISVLMAAFPSKAIAEQSHRFRTLGLGYANLGAMLMQAGIPYDSEDARALAGCLSAILTGRAYATSALMAKQFGPFSAFPENRDAMLRVIRNHRRAANGVSRDSSEYENLSIRPLPIDHALLQSNSIGISNASTLLERAIHGWDDALTLGEKYGYRNAQTTVIAPTGTIGLLMDCDTTGVEPDFALVKFKKLAGGGCFKIANASLRPALHALKYAPDQVDDIMRHVMGALSLDTPMPLTSEFAGGSFREFLLERGFTSEELVQVENGLPTVFDLSFAFTAWSMPPRVLEALNVNVKQAQEDSRFNGLRALGLTSKDIESLNETLCGAQTIEGAPHLTVEHLPVFDCAGKCGRTGTRFIAASGHIRMMAATQPFITGAISKTINLPNESSIDDIADAYRLSWTLGLKANALYRDGSKLSQPLNAAVDTLEDEEDEADIAIALEEVGIAVTNAASTLAEVVTPEPQYIERIVERIVERPLRRRLPDTRQSITHHFNVGGHEGYLTVGIYDISGAPGELFITMSKEGSTIGGLMDSLGTAISVALQYGVPIESLVTKFAHQRFEPMGMTTNRDIPIAKSLVDYIFRWMGMEFIPGYREANTPDRPSHRKTKPLPTPPKSVKENSEWMDDSSEPTPRRFSQEEIIKEKSHKAQVSKDSDQGRTAFHTEAPDFHPLAPPTASVGTSAITNSPINGQSESAVMAETMNRSMAAVQSDAPACPECGHLVVRSGTCYRCENCGNSLGCS